MTKKTVKLNRVRLAGSLMCLLLVVSATHLQPTRVQAADDTSSAPATTSSNGSTEDSSSDQAPQGFFDIVFSGGWTGFLIVMLLLALSLTAAYLVFEHIMTLRASELMPEGLASRVRELLAAERLADAEEACRQQPSFLSFVLVSGLTEADGDWPAVEKALEDSLAEQSARLFRKIEYLSVIANIAPMIGLLGTVTGMIFAFQQVASTQGAAGAGQLAEGIYQALVTTVGGLIVAIPSLGAFAILRNRGDQLVAEVAYSAQHVFRPIKRRRGPATPPAGPAPPPPPPVTGG
jgi:biopolymer transport protein ExbB